MALAAFVVLFYTVPNGATHWVLAASLGTFYILFARALVVPDRIAPALPTYFSIEVLFLTFSYLIFFFPYQLFLLGATDLSTSVFVPDTFAAGSNKAITLATIGMLAFTIGYRLLRLGTHDAEADGDQFNSRRKEGLEAPSLFFQVMATTSSLALIALASVYLLAGWRSAEEGRYTGTTTQAAGVDGIHMLLVMFCMIVAALWIYALAADLPKPPLLAVGLVAAVGWSVRLLVLGDRNAFALIGLVIIGGYFIFVRRAPLVLLIGIFGVAMFVYQALEVLRTIPNWYEDIGKTWQLLPASQAYQNLLSESSFNITTVTLRATVQSFPEEYDFMYGVLKLQQFAALIPFSGRLNLLGINSEETKTSEILRDLMYNYRKETTPGTNIISDSYIDFGVIGVVVVLFAIGLFANALRNYVVRDPHDTHRVVIYLLTVALFAQLPILDIGFVMRILCWTLIFIALVKFISGSLDPRSSFLTVSRGSRPPSPHGSRPVLN